MPFVSAQMEVSLRTPQIGRESDSALPVLCLRTIAGPAAFDSDCYAPRKLPRADVNVNLYEPGPSSMSPICAAMLNSFPAPPLENAISERYERRTPPSWR